MMLAQLLHPNPQSWIELLTLVLLDQLLVIEFALVILV